MYLGWDCHAHTPDCQIYWQALSRREPNLTTLMSADEIQALFCLLAALPATTLAAIQKIRMRSGSHGYGDPHLPDLNITRLLKHVYDLESDHCLLIETLVEIGGTCVQGDSHRLLMLCAALEKPQV